MLHKHTKKIFQHLSKIQGEKLHLTLPNQHQETFGNLNDDSNQKIFELTINDWKVLKLIISRGDIGFAESYIEGLWTTNNLEGLIRLILINRKILENLIYGSFLGSIFYRVKHFFHKNTRSGSKKNIHAHYDLGNEFYSLWLDPSMMYSSALFQGNFSQSLESAQSTKIQKILRELRCSPNEKILEIGCGWGGFMDASLNQGLKITGLTLSQEQKKYIETKFSSTTNAEVLFMDYRDSMEQYDGIASIEMFEAVGEVYWPDYFDTLYRCLKPGKRAVIQTIVIDDQLFEKYRNETDFIQQYIFPGGMLPSVNVFKDHAKRAGLQLINQFEFGEDYAETLRIWSQSFNAQLSKIHQLGFNDKFIRLWNFYLMYCAAGFAEKNINVIQFTLEKPHEVL
jgi:cyclopropane-fatty-acyl-phospholipid synthase